MGIAPATNPPTVQYPPYTPMGSLGHELGILFGFLGACIFVMAIYTVLWQVTQNRNESRDRARRKELHARGFHRERGGLHEKMLDRYAPPLDRAELPASPREQARNVHSPPPPPPGLVERTQSPLSMSMSTGSRWGDSAVGSMREIF